MMYDRKWMLTGLLVVATIFIASTAGGTPIPYNKKELLEQLIKLNDENIPKALKQATVQERTILIMGLYMMAIASCHPSGPPD